MALFILSIVITLPLLQDLAHALVLIPFFGLGRVLRVPTIPFTYEFNDADFIRLMLFYAVSAVMQFVIMAVQLLIVRAVGRSFHYRPWSNGTKLLLPFLFPIIWTIASVYTSVWFILDMYAIGVGGAYGPL